ncbi:hypothetical protein AAG747_03885 [Rapidithrix thailandica]|uniref:Isochorismatase-like domain-containing protein n=1 Tax=Rapidithrix thailandica TaxID=413964 RepID=A0AAW9S7X7_9BACT
MSHNTSKTNLNSPDGKTALLIIDIQNDYFPGGTMELAKAHETAEKAGKILSYSRKEGMLVIHIALQEGTYLLLTEYVRSGDPQKCSAYWSGESNYKK